LSKLVEHLRVHERISVSTETVRQVLRAAGISWQATKTWKGSKDLPVRHQARPAALALRRRRRRSRARRRRVICVDEFGPLNLQPRPGRGWFPRGAPARQRATYHHGGVRQMLAALDLATGQMFYRFRDRKRWQEFLGFLRQLRTRFPVGRLYIVCDNFSPHRKAEVAACAPPMTSSWCSPRATPPG
jgi:hypothetical protein